MYINLGPADHHAALCISRLRWLSPSMKELLRKDGLWEDLMQELYSTAFEAWKLGMDEAETRRFAQRHIYAFLKACGFRYYCRRYVKCELPLFRVFPEDTIFDKGLAPRDAPPMPFTRRKDHLDEKILALLRKHPEGLTRSKVGMSFQISVWEVNRYLAPMIKQGTVVEIRRENIRGRPLSPLFLIAGTEIPEEKMVKTEQDECIRRDYFVNGWSIKRINRELHHDKRIIRRAIYSGNALNLGREKETRAADTI